MIINRIDIVIIVIILKLVDSANMHKDQKAKKYFTNKRKNSLNKFNLIPFKKSIKIILISFL